MNDNVYKNKLQVVTNLLCRLADIDQNDIEYLNRKYDNVKEIKKRYLNKKDNFVILIGDYYLDISNIDESNCKKVAELVALIKLIEKYPNKILEDNTFRLSLPSGIINLANKNNDFFNEILKNNENLDAMHIISDYICENIFYGLSNLKMEIGGNDKEKLDNEILNDIEKTVNKTRFVDNIEINSRYNPYKDVYMHSELHDFTDDIANIFNEENIDRNDDIISEKYFCKYCGEELLFINNMNVYCETCDLAFTLDKINDIFVNDHNIKNIVEDYNIQDDIKHDDFYDNESLEKYYCTDCGEQLIFTENKKLYCNFCNITFNLSEDGDLIIDEDTDNYDLNYGYIS